MNHLGTIVPICPPICMCEDIIYQGFYPIIVYIANDRCHIRVQY